MSTQVKESHNSNYAETYNAIAEESNNIAMEQSEVDYHEMEMKNRSSLNASRSKADEVQMSPDHAPRSPSFQNDQYKSSKSYSPLLDYQFEYADQFERLPSKITRLDRENHPYNENPSSIRRRPPMPVSSNGNRQSGQKRSATKSNQRRARSTGAGSIRSSTNSVGAISRQGRVSTNSSINMDNSKDSADLDLEQGVSDASQRRPSARKKHGIKPTSQKSRKRTNQNRPKASAPSFVTPEEKQELIQKRIQQSMRKSAKMSVYRLMQRRLLKEDYELSREQERQQELALKQKRVQKWKDKMKKSPFSVDLVADSERVEEENRIRELISRKQRQMELKRLEQLKQNLIMNALIEEQNLLHQKSMRISEGRYSNIVDNPHGSYPDDPNTDENEYDDYDHYEDEHAYPNHNHVGKDEYSAYDDVNSYNSYSNGIHIRQSTQAGTYNSPLAVDAANSHEEEDNSSHHDQPPSNKLAQSTYQPTRSDKTKENHTNNSKNEEQDEYIDPDDFDFASEDFQEDGKEFQSLENLKSLEEMRRDALRRFSEQAL